MKKFFCVVLCGLMLTACCACGNNGSDTGGNNGTTAPQNNKPSDGDVEITLDNVMAHDVTPEEDFEIVPYYDEFAVSEYKGNDAIVVIPETIDGKKITGVYGYAFANDDSPSVRAVKLADSIERIGEAAFFNNETIEIVVCGKGLKTIETNAFGVCPSLKELILNDGLESIGEYGISPQSSSLSELTVPDTVKNIEYAGLEWIKVVKGKAGSAVEEYVKSNPDLRIYFEAIE